MANNVNFKVKNGLVIGGDAYLNNASYLHGKLLNGTDTRMFGINSANTLYIGSIDTATGGDWIFINGAERMRINAAGAVRVNTASNLNTNAQFNVYASDHKVMELYSAGTHTRLMLANDNNLNTIDSNSGALTFNVNVSSVITEAARIAGTGAFLVGRTSHYNTYDIASFEKSANADYGISISNQNSTAGSYARLTLGAFGADWHVRAGAAATNSTAFTISRATAEMLRIDSSGNVGIGTTSPSRLLHVRGTTAAASIENISTGTSDFVDFAVIGNDVTGRFSAYGSQHGARSNQVWLNANTSSSLVLGTNNTERMRITPTGDVGIGGTPQRKFHVVADSGIAVSDTATGAITTLAATTTVTSIDCYTTNAAGQAFVVRTNSAGGSGTAERFRITSTGQIGINTSLPSFDFDLQKSQNAASVMRVYNGNTGASASSVIVAQTDTVTLNMFANGSGQSMSGVTSLAGIQVTTNTPFGLWTNNIERLRISAAGNVGIGQASPLAPLHIGGGGGGSTLKAIFAQGSDVNFWLAVRNGSDSANTNGGELFRLGTEYAGAFAAGLSFTRGGGASDASMLLHAGSAERVRINAAGDVMVGGTSVFNSSQLSLYTGASQNGLGINVSTTGSYAGLYINRSASDGIVAAFDRAGVRVGQITVTASATAYATSSDERLKKNIVDAPEGIERVKAIKVRSYDFKADDSHVDHGFIAQELNEVEPSAVTQGDTWGVDYSKLVPVLTKALQEALAKIEALEARISNLEA